MNLNFRHRVSARTASSPARLPLLAIIVFDDEDDFDFQDPLGGHEMTARERAENFLLKAVFFQSAIAFIAVGLGALLGVAPWISASWQSGSPMEVLWIIGVGTLATLPLLGVFLVMQYGSFESLEDLQEMMDRHIVPLFREATILELGFLSLLVGLGEEALFRGVVQTFLQELMGLEAGPAVPIVIASLLFGLLHSLTKEYFVISTLMGAYFGFWFWWTDDIIVPIVMHTLYDWFVLVYMKRHSPVFEEATDEN